MSSDTTDLSEMRLQGEERDVAFEKSVGYSVAPTAFLMMCGYIVLTIAHPFVLPQPESIVMASLAGATGLACAFVWRQGSGVLTRYVDSHQTISILTLLILVNVSLHMWMLKDHLQTTQFALMMVGSGFLMLHRGWFAFTLAAYLGTWTTLNWILGGSPNSTHFGYLMSISTLVAVAAHIARRQTTVRAETARIASEHERLVVEERARKQQEHLEHVSRLLTLGELVAGISHELNQPLASISNLATACEMMLEQEESTPLRDRQGEAVKGIADAANRAGVIIKRLRGLATKSSRPRSEVNMNQVVKDAAELMSADARHRNGELLLELDPNLTPVQADEVQMQQVVLNLLQNGFDALEDTVGGQVIVKTSVSGGAAQVTVADTGPGIQIENPNSVFEAFFTTKEHGMGMGLAICRSIMESHGGSISCALREPDGSGTVFHLSIPITSKQINDQSKPDGMHY